MISPVDPLIKERKEEKRGKMKIVVGSCDSEGRRDGRQYKQGKKQKDEEEVYGVCPGYGGEEEVLN